MAMLTKTLQSQTESLQQVEGQLKAYRAHEVEELMNLGLSIQLEADSMRLKNEIEVLKSKKRVVERELHIERADKERVIRSNQALVFSSLSFRNNNRPIRKIYLQVRDLNVEAAKVAATKKRLQDVEIDLEGLKKVVFIIHSYL